MEVRKYQQEVDGYPSLPAGADGVQGRVRRSAGEAARILRRGRRTFIAVFAAVVGLVVFYTLVVDPVYEAYTVIVIDESAAPGIGESVMTASAGESRRDAVSEALLLEQSLVIAERAAQRLIAAGDTAAALRLTALEPENKGPLTLTQIAARLQEEFIKVTPEDVRPGRNMSNALRITARSTSAAEAALLANAVAEAYVEQGVELSRRRTTLTRTFLEDQLARHEDRLRGLEKDVQQYMTTHGAGALEEEVRETVSRLSKLEAELDAARIEEQRSAVSLESLESELESIRPKLAAFIASGADDEIKRTHDDISRLAGELEKIYIRNPELRRDASGSADVMALQNKVAQLNERVTRLSAKYVDELMAVGGTEPLEAGSGSNMTYVTRLKRQIADERVAMLGAQAQQSALQARINQYRGRLSSIPAQSVQLAQLKREHEAAENLYVRLGERLREVRMLEEAEPGLARIIRPALVPEKPVRPHFRLSLLLGVLLGLSFGVGAAFVRNRFDRRIHSPNDLLAYNISTIGVVPHEGQVQDALPVPASKGQAPVALPAGSASPFGEAFRRIYLNVEAQHLSAPPAVVLVTSAEPGAGKSTSILNLAFAAMRTGKRILILDADFRRPQIYRLLGHSDGPTIEDVLGVEDFDVERLRTGIQDVYALGTRTPLENPDIVLRSEKLTMLFEQLRQEFDLILVDSPPVLAVADALVLARLADATLVVASAAETDGEALEQALAELRNADANLLGTILNRYDPTMDGSGYHYQYRDYGYL